jgi:hypothetical protein
LQIKHYDSQRDVVRSRMARRGPYPRVQTAWVVNRVVNANVVIYKAFVDLGSTCVKPLPNRDEPVMAAKDLCAFSRLLADGVSHWLDAVRHLPNPSAVPGHLV